MECRFDSCSGHFGYQIVMKGSLCESFSFADKKSRLLCSFICIPVHKLFPFLHKIKSPRQCVNLSSFAIRQFSGHFENDLIAKTSGLKFKYAHLILVAMLRLTPVLYNSSLFYIFVCNALAIAAGMIYLTIHD